MVIWPWSRFRQYDARLERLTNDLLLVNANLIGAAHAAEIAALNLRTTERDLERALAELHLVQQDFKQLVHVTARPVSKTTPIDFTRDPFTEDPKLPDSWLTDDSVLPDIEVIEEIISGQGQAGKPGRSGSTEGAEGPA